MGLTKEASLARARRLLREARYYRASDCPIKCPECGLGVPRAIGTTHHPTCGPDAAALLAADAPALAAYLARVRATLEADLADPAAARARARASVRTALAQGTDNG